MLPLTSRAVKVSSALAGELKERSGLFSTSDKKKHKPADLRHMDAEDFNENSVSPFRPPGGTFSYLTSKNPL